MADPTVTSHQAIAPKAEPGAKVGITIDGRELQVDAGQFLIAAAEDAGVFIPRFCYHPRIKPVGMCRMCLVEVSGPRGSRCSRRVTCAVADGMVVDTTSDRREEGTGRGPRVPARQPSARLPGVRQGRGVPAAGPGARLRTRREPVHRGEAPLGEADRALGARAARP